MYYMHSRWLALLLAGIACACVAAEEEERATAAGAVVMIELRDAIGPATADFFVRSLKRDTNSAMRSPRLLSDTPFESRTVPESRANATAADIAPKVETVRETWWSRLWAKIIAITMSRP